MKVFFRQQPDANGVSRRGKPDGVAFCEVALNVGNIIINPEQCPNRKLLSRTSEIGQFEEYNAGQKAFVAARWVTPRGEAGPWSDVLEFIIP